MFNPRKSKGFTLIEILFVVIAIGILAAIVVLRMLHTALEAKIAANDANKANINTSVERYFFDEGSWPAADLSDIGADGDYFPEGVPLCPVCGLA
ncbi:MAG: type II secretion system GspH family protein [Candidatus Omnitrophica bacterium]|nr:type II secretion system GspH family protein [Candidatus Omnitrophota bacterium]MBU1047263.1 type II secretion system GspH family protein [Candidatus Omnitrophota bacterium]MBU1630232.1 type II secretion system GspH family protein [Candidatus Omnitrophota bacterium]MBU1767189.1 type II secretion system GspH family protein [Candidatus Omnitrophota bacterium]MBU1889152.1 type II secretion system GspH family protein [Candidatus Omnitrophota bacterium]